MYTLIMVAMFAVIAFLAAWVVNSLIGLLSGERPGDTGRVWWEIFLKLFSLLELGFIGRILNSVGFDGLLRKRVLFIGLLCALFFLVKACHQTDNENVHTYPVQTLSP